MPRRPIVLKNIGPVSAGWLAAVGVSKRADLIRLGAVAAFLRVKAAGHKPSLNLLWALAGAERGLPWSRLTEQDREHLLMELDAAGGGTGTPAAPSAAEAPLRPAAKRKPAQPGVPAKPSARAGAKGAARPRGSAPKKSTRARAKK